MATHSSLPTREILWTEDSEGLQSMGLQRVRHLCATEYEYMRKQFRSQQEERCLAAPAGSNTASPPAGRRKMILLAWWQYKALTYSFPYLEPICCSMSSFNCCFLTCIQISQEAGLVAWYSHIFKNFPQFVVIHTVKGCGIVNKQEIDVSLELSCFFDNPTGIGNLISASSAFTKSSLNIWKFTVHLLLKPGLENFEHYFTSMWDECNSVVVWTFFGIAFLWDWNENWPFPVLWPLLSFPNLLAYWVQHFHSIIFQDLK